MYYLYFLKITFVQRCRPSLILDFALCLTSERLRLTLCSMSAVIQMQLSIQVKSLVPKVFVQSIGEFILATQCRFLKALHLLGNVLLLPLCTQVRATG